jgi:hypothetical protein
MTKKYKLRAPDGNFYESDTPGSLGGYVLGKIYGRLNCWSANKFLAKGGYAAHRVFFADEAAAIASGFRPCGHCMKERHKQWKLGGEQGSANYPWLILPKEKENLTATSASKKFVSEYLTITRPQCLDCSRQDSEDPFRCQAFPDGTPNDILENIIDHQNPYPGDGGLRFSAKP